MVIIITTANGSQRFRGTSQQIVTAVDTQWVSLSPPFRRRRLALRDLSSLPKVTQLANQ